MEDSNIRKYTTIQKILNGTNNSNCAYIVVLLAIVLLNSLPGAFVLFFDQGREIIRGMTGPPSVHESREFYGYLTLPVILLAMTMASMTLTSTLLWSKFVSAMSESAQEKHSKPMGKASRVVTFFKSQWLFDSYFCSLLILSFKYTGNCFFGSLLGTYVFVYISFALIAPKLLRLLMKITFKKEIDIRGAEENRFVKIIAGGVLLFVSLIVPCIFFYTLESHRIPAVMLGPVAMATAICEVLATCALFFLLVMPNHALVVTSVCACLAAWWAFHANRSHGDIQLVRLESDALPPKFRTQPADFAVWLKHIQPGPDGKKLVILALASGGGARAASFASQVLANLQDENPTLFFPHLYAVSGVSGGSIGVATVAGEMADAIIGKSKNFTEISENVSARDLLTPVFYHLLVTDALCQLSNIARLCQSDRSSALDDAIMNNWFTDDDQGPNQAIHSFTSRIFSSTLADYAQRRERDLTQDNRIVRPVLLFGTTDVQTAQTVIISSSAGLVTSEESGGVRLLKMPGNTLRIGTAVSLSARFPLITAPGRIDLGHNSATYLTDGGYSDNSGARAMLVLLQNLFSTMPDSDLDALNLLVLQIDANPCHSKDGESPQQECDSYLKPAFKTYFMADAFTAFESIRERNTREALADLKKYLHDSRIKTTFVTYLLSPKPYVVPLGWYISTESQENIKQSIKCYTHKENEQVRKLLQSAAQGNDTAEFSRAK